MNAGIRYRLAKKKIKLEIIDETAEYYSADPKGRRAVTPSGICSYLMEDGRKCAVGRYMIDPSSVDDNQTAEGFDDLDALLEPECRGHGVEFWLKLQKFHDSVDNWSETGLSTYGQSALTRLRNTFTT